MELAAEFLQRRYSAKARLLSTILRSASSAAAAARSTSPAAAKLLSMSAAASEAPSTSATAAEAPLPTGPLDAASSFLAQWVASEQFVDLGSRSLSFIKRATEMCLDSGWATPARVLVSLRAANHMLFDTCRNRNAENERVRAAAWPIIQSLWNLFLTHTPGFDDDDQDHDSTIGMLPGPRNNLTLLSLLTRPHNEYKIVYPGRHANMANTDSSPSTSRACRPSQSIQPVAYPQSTWYLMSELAPRDGTFAQLAYILAPALCVVSRLTKDSEQLKVEFLTYLEPRNMFEWIRQYTLQAHHRTVMRSIALHFRELDPEWWAEATELLQNEEYSFLKDHLVGLPKRCERCPHQREPGEATLHYYFARE